MVIQGFRQLDNIIITFSSSTNIKGIQARGNICRLAVLRMQANTTAEQERADPITQCLPAYAAARPDGSVRWEQALREPGLLLL